MKSMPSFRAFRSLVISLAFAAATGHAAEVWTLVTSTSDLAADETYMIAAKTAEKTMGPYASGNNIKAVDFNKSSGVSESGLRLTLELDSDSGSYYFHATNGYLYAASSSSNYLKIKSSKDANGNSLWAISIASDGTASITAQGDYTRNVMQYNSGSTLFSCYASASQQPVCLYKRTITQDTIPSISVDPTELQVFLGEPATATITTNSAVRQVTVSHGSLSGSTWTWTPTATGPTAVIFTAVGDSMNRTAEVLVTVNPPRPPTISVSPTTTTVTLGEIVTATITTNHTAQSVSISPNVGTLVGNTWTWLPNAIGYTEVTFTATGVSGTATATVSVTVTPAALDITPTISNVLSNGTGFAVNWTPVSNATSYEVQVATNGQFDVVDTVITNLDFPTQAIPTDWTGNTGGFYTGAQYYNSSPYSIKFSPSKNATQFLTSPTYSEGISAVRFWAYVNDSKDPSDEAFVLKQNGVEITSVSLANENYKGTTYEVVFPQAVSSVTFSFTKKAFNVALDDIVLLGTPWNSVVQTIPANGASASSVPVTGLLPNTTYFVRVRAVNNGQYSDWSDSASATTPSGGTPFPPGLSVTPTTASITGGQSVSFTVTYSDPNSDSLTLAIADNGTQITNETLAGTVDDQTYSYTFAPAVVGEHRLVFSLTDGTFTTYSTNDVSVSLSAPVIGDATAPTTNPYGFTAHWSTVATADGYDVEVATDPLFDGALGKVVFTEDFLSLTDILTGWSIKPGHNNNTEQTLFRFTSSGKCGDRMPAFRFEDGCELESPPFQPGGKFLQFFAFCSKGTNTLYAIGNTANGEETKTFTLTEGRGIFATNFSAAVTSLRFMYSQGADGGFVGLDDIVVREVQSLDSRLENSQHVQGGTTNSLALTALDGAASYYVRVRATSGAIVSDWSATTEIPFLAAPENVEFISGKWIESGSSLSWDAAIGATSYNVKVREADIVANTELIAEDFYLGKTAPAGWTFHGIGGTYADGSLKLDDQGDYVMTPAIEYPAQSVSFYSRANSGSNPHGGGYLTVYALVSNEWKTVQTLCPGLNAAQKFEYALPANTTKVKIEFTEKGTSTNFSLGDFVIMGTGPVWHDYNTFNNITATTLPLPNLHHDSPYEFIVSAVNEFGEIAADPLKVTAPPTNPATLLKFR